MAENPEGLTVAVTGPTGTFGFGLMPLLEADKRIERIVGIARRPFDPAEHGWSKLDYRRGDVRDQEALARGVRRRRRRRPPRVHHHRARIPGDDPRDQRRGHAERVPGRGRRRRQAVRLRVVGGGLRVPRRQPRRDDRGLADAPRRPPLLRAGEGGDRARCSARRPPPSRSSTSTCCARRSCSARTPWARRTCCPSPLAPLGARRVRGAAPAARAVPVPVPRPARAVHPRGRRRPGLPAVHRRRRPAGRLQHRRRRRARGADVARELGLLPAADAGAACAGRRARARPLPFAPPGARVGRGDQPARRSWTPARRRSELGWRPEYDSLQALRATLPE